MPEDERPAGFEGEPPAGSGQGPRARHGRHVGDPADAPRRATRPATNAPARLPAHRRAADVEPVLPRSKDDLDVGWGGASDGGDTADDERFLREVPPHWQ